MLAVRAQPSRLLPCKRLIGEKLRQPGIERSIEVLQNPLCDWPHGPQVPVLGAPCIGCGTPGHQGLLFLT